MNLIILNVLACKSLQVYLNKTSRKMWLSVKDFYLKYMKGERCERKISNCNNVKCLNGGFCVEETGKCACLGFTGERCEKPLPQIFTNPCASNPCEKGVCAYVKNLGYKCYCLPNYTGIFLSMSFFF